MYNIYELIWRFNEFHPFSNTLVSQLIYILQYLNTIKYMYILNDLQRDYKIISNLNSQNS